MRLPLFIARRYFLSKKSQRAINIISMISVAGVLVGTAALVIVLSVFNGFEDLILRLYNSFDPDIQITSASGKNFTATSIPFSELKNDKDIRHILPVIEEKALVRYNERQYIVTLKGVDDEFSSMTGIDSMIIDGSSGLTRGDTDYAVIGAGVAYGIQLGMSDFMSQIEVYAPKRSASSLLNAEEAFNRRFIQPSGVFAVQQEYDSRYVLVPFRFAQELLEYDSLISSIEIALQPGASAETVRERLMQRLGDGFVVKDRLRLHADIYKIMKSEKWAVFLILTFILIIATFNLIGTLSMLVIEKKKDIAVLHSMGADEGLLRRIFLTEGLFINLIGCVSGMIIGFLTCYAQQHFGIIKLSGSGSFVIDSYPVRMALSDFIFVFLTVSIIGLAGSWYPAKRMVGQSLDLSVVRNDE